MITKEQVVDALFSGETSWTSWEDIEHQCHAASLALVRSGILPVPARVARGSCEGVPGQHSWVVIGDPYGAASTIVDVTRWSYDGRSPKVWFGSALDRLHTPHGSGDIWQWGCPAAGSGEGIPLDVDLSDAAQAFLDLVADTNDREDGMLDRYGWSSLTGAPVGGGWPAKEIIEGMLDTDRLATLVPIDIEGMLTDRNPGNLYW